MAHGGDGSVPAQAFLDAGKGIPGYDKVLQTGFELVEKLRSVPAILVPLIGGRPETQAFATQAAMWASVIPAVWSFMLALRERGLIFVGIDVIDGHLTEINVTSPTGIRAIKALGGPDIAAMIWDVI